MGSGEHMSKTGADAFLMKEWQPPARLPHHSRAAAQQLTLAWSRKGCLSSSLSAPHSAASSLDRSGMPACGGEQGRKARSIFTVEQVPSMPGLQPKLAQTASGCSPWGWPPSRPPCASRSTAGTQTAPQREWEAGRHVWLNIVCTAASTRQSAPHSQPHRSQPPSHLGAGLLLAGRQRPCRRHLRLEALLVRRRHGLAGW